MDKRNILFIGGDKRQLYCAAYLYRAGYECSVFGFELYDSIPKELMIYNNLKIAVLLADVIVLPTPSIVDGKIYAPFSQEDILPEDILRNLNANQIVVASKCDEQFLKKLEKKNVKTLDCLKNEEYTVKNAFLTAEGAIQVLMNASESSLFEQNILILGFGRIAKHFIRLLLPFRTKICVAARKKSDLTWAKLMGCQTVLLSSDISLAGYDAIINTVPAPIFKQSQFCENRTTFIDLAPTSNYTFEQYYKENGLPGRYAPGTAGKYLGEWIQECLEVCDE